MQTQTNPAARNGIVAAYGYGIKIHVYRRHLVIEDGIAEGRRSRRYHRAASKLRRLVLIGRTGYITLEAIRWLHDVGAALVHIDADGQLLTTSTLRGRNLPALRRAQALAADQHGRPSGRPRAAARKGRRAGLASVRDTRGDRARLDIDRALADIEQASTLRDLLDAEARAAAAYWGAWAPLPVPIATRGRQAEQTIPEHWRTFGQRQSLLTSGPRGACNPANAILNYLYALLEAETTLACQQIGLDPRTRNLPHRPA